MTQMCDCWDGLLFSVQTITTTGYGNYNELFGARKSLRELSVGLMIIGAIVWSFLVGIGLKWIEKTVKS